MIAQGATSFMGAASSEAAMRAVKALGDTGDFPIRANFSIHISPEEAADASSVLERINKLKRRYSDRSQTVVPGVSVGTVKLFVDGDFMSPSLRGAFLEPYQQNVGTTDNPAWVSTGNSGELYFPSAVLEPLLKLLDQHGWQFHMHANGDRAIRTVLDAVEAAQIANQTRNTTGNRRHTITHLLLIDEHDIPRFAELGVVASMSLQWAKRDEYHVDLTAPYIGPERFSRIYPTRPLIESGARIAYGSDAPVDPLNYWYAMEVAVTRTGEGQGKYAGPLNAEFALTREQVIEALTIHSAYQLKQEQVTGSLEPGKFADLILLDRNLFEIPVTELSETKVLMTMVGGRVVYRAGH